MLLLVLIGLALCALLVRRHHRRSVAAPPVAVAAPVAAAPVPTATTPPAVTSVPPMDAFQSGVKLDARTSTTPDAETKRRLLERLQAEERRQRPELQRN